MKAKKQIIIIITIVILLLCGFLVFKYKDSNKLEKEKNNKETTLWNDYKNGIIDLNTYIKYNIYNTYDSEKLDKKYQNSEIINLDNIIENNIDKLSKDTIELYLYYFSLPKLTFKFKTKNKQMQYNLESSETTINLDKVLLSPNKKILFWYTDSGNNATQKAYLEKYAKLLDEAIVKYDNLFDTNYYYQADIIYKNQRYKDQLEILKNNNIDEEYLSKAINVYVYNFNPRLQGMYCTAVSDLFSNSNEDGTVLSSYILLNSQYTNEIYSTIFHELFHYYQNYIINNNGTKNIVKDNIIGEATAQWATAKIFENTNINDNLNIWVTNYLRHTGDIYTDMYEKVGDEIGYALFKFLYSYENNVVDGKNKILNSIHSDNGLKYLSDNSTKEEKKNVLIDLSEKNLSNNYPNNNYLSIDNEKVRTRKEFNNDKDYDETFNLSVLGMNYYHILNTQLKNNYKILVTSKNTDKLSILIIENDNNQYKIISNINNTKDIALYTKDINSEDYYIIIINTDFTNNYEYTVTITKDTIKNTQTFNTDFDNCKIKGISSVTINGVETNSKYEGVLDQKHQKEKLIASSSIFGITIDTESYSDFSTGYSYTKNPLTNKWERTKTTNSIMDLSKLISKINNINSKEIRKVEKNHYSLKLNSIEAKDIFSSTGNDIDVTKFKDDAYMDIYITDNKISKLKYDFSNIIDEIEDFKMTLEFYDYNKADDVLIPSEALN